MASGCPEAPYHGSLYEPAELTPEIAGTAQDGKPFSLKAGSGRVRVVFFGYTYCPDICPMTLSQARSVREDLGEAAEGLDFVFVSVDPARDSVERLASYMPNFGPGITGLRVPLSELDLIARNFFIGFTLHPPDENGYYAVDHTGSLFVIDRSDNLRLRFTQEHSVGQMVEDLKRLLSETPDPKGIRISEIRSHPAAEGPGVAYMRIVNHGPEDDRLLAVGAVVADRSEFHETVHHGEHAAMESRAEGFPLAAGEALVLEAGGKHVMLHGLSSPLEVGDHFPMRLFFENSGDIPITVPVIPR